MKRTRAIFDLIYRYARSLCLIFSLRILLIRVLNITLILILFCCLEQGYQRGRRFLGAASCPRLFDPGNREDRDQDELRASATTPATDIESRKSSKKDQKTSRQIRALRYSG